MFNIPTILSKIRNFWRKKCSAQADRDTSQQGHDLLREAAVLSNPQSRKDRKVVKEFRHVGGDLPAVHHHAAIDPLDGEAYDGRPAQFIPEKNLSGDIHASVLDQVAVIVQDHAAGQPLVPLELDLSGTRFSHRNPVLMRDAALFSVER